MVPVDLDPASTAAFRRGDWPESAKASVDRIGEEALFRVMPHAATIVAPARISAVGTAGF